LSILIHATEDPDRILAAISGRLEIPSHEFKLEQLLGHFKNPVLRASFEARGKEAEKIAQRITAALPEEDYRKLKADAQSYLQEGAIHFRLDRDFMVAGEVRLSSTDPFKIELRLAPQRVSVPLVELLELIRSGAE